jgi:hypothetical protein
MPTTDRFNERGPDENLREMPEPAEPDQDAIDAAFDTPSEAAQRAKLRADVLLAIAKGRGLEPCWFFLQTEETVNVGRDKTEHRLSFWWKAKLGNDLCVAVTAPTIPGLLPLLIAELDKPLPKSELERAKERIAELEKILAGKVTP